MTPADILREYTRRGGIPGGDYAYTVLDTDAMAAEIARLREVLRDTYSAIGTALKLYVALEDDALGTLLEAEADKLRAEVRGTS